MQCYRGIFDLIIKKNTIMFVLNLLVIVFTVFSVDSVSSSEFVDIFGDVISLNDIEIQLDEEFGFRYDTGPNYVQVECSKSHHLRRQKYIDEAACGAPVEVQVELYPYTAEEEVNPRTVWVKRCIGMCEFIRVGTCSPTAVGQHSVPVRVYNARTEKERCARYTVEEHVRCACNDTPVPYDF